MPNDGVRQQPGDLSSSLYRNSTWGFTKVRDPNIPQLVGLPYIKDPYKVPLISETPHAILPADNTTGLGRAQCFSWPRRKKGVDTTKQDFRIQAEKKKKSALAVAPGRWGVRLGGIYGVL